MILFTALGYNPAPGDAAGVAELAERYQRISARLGTALERLTEIGEATGLWEGAAAEAFVSDVQRLPEYLGLAADSTGAAGSAIGEWATTLPELQREAEDLELKARKARANAGAARDDPAFDLVWQTFPDQETLRAAQQLVDAASARLTAAIDDLEAIQEAAERLRDRHSTTADDIAGQLDSARELAPDEPRGGIMGGITNALGDMADTVVDTAVDVGEFAIDNANRIEAVSGFISDVSSVVGLAADLEIPVVSQVLGGVSIGLDAVALGGLGIADVAGADVSGEQYRQTSVSLGSSLVGLAPGVQGTVVEEVVNQVGNFGGGPYEPRNGRQELELALSAVPQFGVLRHAVAVENTVSDFADWGEEWREAGEADEAARRERER